MRFTDTDRKLVRETIPLIRERTLQYASCLFEDAVKNGYDLKFYVENFMRSKTARLFDTAVTKYQWLGEEYMDDDFQNDMLEEGREIPKAGNRQLASVHYLVKLLRHLFIGYRIRIIDIYQQKVKRRRIYDFKRQQKNRYSCILLRLVH